MRIFIIFYFVENTQSCLPNIQPTMPASPLLNNRAQNLSFTVAQVAMSFGDAHSPSSPMWLRSIAK